MVNFSGLIENAEKDSIRDGHREFTGKYMKYQELKLCIDRDVQRSLVYEVEEKEQKTRRVISMSIPFPPAGYEFNPAFEEAAAMISQTADTVMQDFRGNVLRLLDAVNREENMLPAAQQSYLKEAERLGDKYIATEKYVNLNYLGLHKILKKHDKNIPTQPVYQFYINYLHREKWLSGDYTHELVQLSELFSKLRGDGSGVKNDDAAQGFIRSTKKYWVKEQDASNLRFTVLQHLPVFRFDDSIDADYQLVNSVYLDNCSCELYHGRLDKRPGAQAIRLRWYGTGVPEIVFVERKVHNEDWTGESSTKERFPLPEEKVLPYLRGEYMWDQMKADMAAQGRQQKDVDAVQPLFCAVQKKVFSAILRPTVRTQYQRCAFQIPFDATVRVSLDTNLRMYKELPDEENPLWSWDMGLLTPRPAHDHAPGTNLSRSSANGTRAGAARGTTRATGVNASELSSESGEDSIEFKAWRRNESEQPWKRTELHRFPHCILEVKLSLPEGENEPEWVTGLLNGRDRLGFEIHKFSKFIQGTAVLYPGCVQAVPYWIDDASLKPYMLVCADPTSENNAEAGAKARTRAATAVTLAHEPDAPHPLHQQNSQALDLFTTDDNPAPPRGGLLHALSTVPKLSFFDRLVGAYVPRERGRYMHAMKIEPKSFFANERTFLAWLHMAVTIGSVSAALLGFAATADRNRTQAADVASVEVICMILLPLAVVLCFYSLFIFLWRSQNIAIASNAPINDRTGPVCLAGVVVLALSAIFIISIRELVVTMHARDQDMAFLVSCFIDSQ